MLFCVFLLIIYIVLHGIIVIIAVKSNVPSLPLCSREGGTAVPDEIEVAG